MSRTFLVAVVLSLVGLSSISGQEPKTASTLTADEVVALLESHFYNDRARAVDALESSAGLRTDSRVRAALMAELHRVRLETESIRAGAVPNKEPREAWGEYQLRLADAVSLLGDTAALDDMVWFAGTSRRVATALAAFGEVAAPTVLSTLESGSARGRDLLPRGLMFTLQTMLVSRSVGPAIAAQIISASHRALTTSSDPLEVEGAIDLAAAVHDPGLLADVAELARGVDRVIAHGIQDPRFADAIQKHAARVSGLR